MRWYSGLDLDLYWLNDTFWPQVGKEVLPADFKFLDSIPFRCVILLVKWMQLQINYGQLCNMQLRIMTMVKSHAKLSFELKQHKILPIKQLIITFWLEGKEMSWALLLIITWWYMIPCINP